MNTDLLIIVGIGLAVVILGIVARFFAEFVWPDLQNYLVANGRDKEAVLIGGVVATAVQYAEQVGDDNAGKKMMALEFATRELGEYGVDVDQARLEAWVEAAVLGVLKPTKPD